jgi:hypothetical protein
MKKLFASILFSFFATTCCQADTTEAVFARYPNPYFVETGSLRGDGIQMALNVGFPSVYSIELSDNFYNVCKERFRGNPKVHLVKGSSGDILYSVIKDIKEPITFWLDGHYSGGDTARTEKNTPILEELEQIKKHPIKTHTILIDDMRCCNTWLFDFISKETIIQKIKEINPRYIITYDRGCEPKDVLVARVLPRRHKETHKKASNQHAS